MGAYGVYVFPKEIVNPQIVYEWKQSASDTIVFAGCTMPKGKYFSFQHYVNERIVDGKGTQLFADLGATVNNLDINTSSGDDLNNFDSLTTVILTGDEQTAMDLQSVLDHKTLNILSIPNEYVYFEPGTNSTTDTFSILYRMALWENTTEYIEYVNNINHQTVWKLSLTESVTPRIPYDPYVRDINCSYNETDIYNNAMTEYANDLIKYIESTYSYKYIATIPFIDRQIPPYHYYGFSCIEYNYNCIGETRDATYWGFDSTQNQSDVMLYDKKSFYLILGVNHANTKQSEYVSITLYDNEPKVGEEVKGDLSNLEMNGTALLLPVNTDVDKEYLSNMWLTQLSRPINCMYNDDGLLIPGFCYNQTQFNESSFLLVTRNYLNPETKTHPNKDQIIGPVILYFET